MLTLVCRGLSFALALATFLAVPAAGTSAADPSVAVNVRPGVHKDFVRIAFDWPRRVAFKADVANDRLTIRFGQPFTADFTKIERKLRRWIGTATLSGDGRSVSFPVSRPATARTFHHRNSAIVDLKWSQGAQRRAPRSREPDVVPLETAAKGSTTTPAAEAKPASTPATEPTVKPAADGPRIRVRTGEHRHYSRMVFDWPHRVDYRVDRSGDAVTVSFAEPAQFRLRNRKPARRIRSAEAQTASAGSAVVLSVPVDARVRHLRVGKRVVVDVFGAGSAKRAGKGSRLAGSVEVPPDTGTQPSPANVANSQAPPQPSQPVDPPTDVAAEPIEAETTEAAAAAPEAEEPPRDPASATHNLRTPDSDEAQAETHTPAAALVERSADDAEHSMDAHSEAAEEHQPAKSVVLRFAWPEPVAAAVFERGSHLWIVFDAASHFDAGSLKRNAGAAVLKVDEIPAEHATALRLHLAAGLHPHVRRDGSQWLVDLTPERRAAIHPLSPEVRLDGPVGPSVFLSETGPGRPITLTDPEVGDTLIVVPLLPLHRGLDHSYTYPQFGLLASSQGVAVTPRSEDLVVRALERGVEISSTGDLHVSPVPALTRSQRALGADATLSRTLEPERWEEPSDDRFLSERQQLLRAAAEAAPGHREPARMDLARFFLTRGFGAEGLGVLRLIAGDRPEAESESRFRLMRGIARFLTGRFEDAATDFEHASLEDVDEGVLWRAMTTAATGHMVEAAPEFERAGAVALSYPTALRVPAVSLAAESLSAAGKATAARPYLDVVAAESERTVPQGRLDYLRGRWHEAGGDDDAALALYDGVADSDDRHSRTSAMLAATDLRLRRGWIGTDEALEILDVLRAEWRGDSLEFAILRKYGRLAISEGRFAEGLRAWRSIVMHFPDAPETAAVTHDMARTFSSLFLEGDADALPPHAAIALFDEFRELTPAGDVGNEMIRRLADRLVAVDLLERAAALLEDQVRLRLTGVPRARVGARLALIHLLDRRPKAALAALAASEPAADDNLSDGLVQQRGQLKARAFIELGRKDDALAALADDTSIEADLVRAELFWRSRDWALADEALSRIAEAKGARAGAPLDEQQARFVLNRAVALTLDGNEADLARLRSGYGPAMNATPYRDAFRLIAAGDPGPAEDGEIGLIDALDRGLSDVDDFHAFLAVYRDRLREGGLSAIN